MKSTSNNSQSRGIAPVQPRLEAVPRSKRRRDRAAKERALIASALKLFASKGYEATTTREIAASAGCAEGLIHRYFKGKAGLLPALIENRISKEVADVAHHVPPAQRLEDEYLRLVDWAVDCMWADREFLRVVVPRALLDPSLGQILHRVGPLQKARAIAERLKKFKECRALPAAELDALAQFVSVVGFMFGFMRPAVLRQDRKSAANTATAIARLVVRSLPSHSLSRNGHTR
jgi:AcrR family transcriptional regulator